MAVADDLSRYRYISRLGSGGMARVDLAEDTLLERRVALKRMSEATDRRGVSRLRREAITGASLSHPNLVSIYDVCTGDDGRLVLVMEYVAGETLRARINRDRKLPLDDSLRILEGIAAGLDAIHSRGIVHRDVKPSNILLGEDGVVKLADLGIASVPDGTRITTSGSIIGSLSYMAPEQLADTRASPAIDVYALAAVAFEMLSGRKARREPNAVALAHALATQPPTDLRSAWPAAPVAAAEVLSRGMARDPKARPRSAGELVARLKAALMPEPTAALTPEPTAARPAPIAARRAPKPAEMPIAGLQRARPAAAAAVRPLPPSPRRGARTGAVAAALLGLVAAAVVLVVVLNSGGRQHQPSSATSAIKQPARAAPGHRTTRSASRSASSASRSTRSASRSTSTPAPSPAVSAPSTSAGAGAASSGASSPSSASPAARGATGAATTPVSAVESFYDLAAAHRYSQAWALADSSMRAQLRSYPSFQAGQTGTRAITFNSARTVSQSTGGATVAIQTTSVRNDGTHHCTGTVDLVPAGSSGWMLHQIHIGCTP